MTRQVARAFISCIPSFFLFLFFLPIIFTAISSSIAASLPSAVDLTVHNLSVQCVHNVQSAAAVANSTQNTTLSTDASPPRASNIHSHPLLSFLVTLLPTRQRLVTPKVSHIIATWDDHPFAAHSRTLDTRLQQEDDEKSDDAPAAAVYAPPASYTYEVQMWVASWTVDGIFWHDANRVVTTKDPLVVLENLPLEEHEMQFRVRLKATRSPASLLEQLLSLVSVFWFLLPVDIGSSEIVGEWSDVVTFSAASMEQEEEVVADDQVEALVALFVNNPVVFVLLTLCIGSSCLVVAQLYVRRRRAALQLRRRWNLQSSRFKSYESAAYKRKGDFVAADSRENDGAKSRLQLEHEIRDLRQEVADVEHEVRRLLLYRGYGIELLARDELNQLEKELRHTLERIRERKQQDGTLQKEAETVDGYSGQ